MNKENFIFAKGFNNPSRSLGSSPRRAFVTWFIASVPGEQTFAIWVTPDPWKNLIKITILRKRRKGLVASRPANYLHPPWRSGKYNGWCEKTARGQIYIYISWQILLAEMFPTASPVSTLVTGIYLERAASILISGHRPDGRGRSGLCDEFTSTLRRILGISAPLIKGLRCANISNTLPASCYSFFSFFFFTFEHSERGEGDETIMTVNFIFRFNLWRIGAVY